MESKMTAVEWLVSQLNKQGFAQVVTDEEIQQAKEMEKRQHIGTYIASMCRPLDMNKCPIEQAEQYYNETYQKGGKK